MNEPRCNHALDGYTLFLARYTLVELEDAEKNCNPNEPAGFFSALFDGHTPEHFRALDHRIRDGVIPLSDRPELLALAISMEMAYVHKDQNALLIQSGTLLVLLTKSVSEQEFVEKVQKQTGPTLTADI